MDDDDTKELLTKLLQGFIDCQTLIDGDKEEIKALMESIEEKTK